MKLFAIIAMLMAGAVCAEHSTTEILTHNAVPDKIIKSGAMVITSEQISTTEFKLKLKYKLKAKIFIFKKTIEGEQIELLPIKFLYNYGYLELEETGSMIYKNIELTHVKRINLENYEDCHEVHLRPLTNKKWEGNIVYCPGVQSIGFAKTNLTYNKVPFIGQHTLTTVLAE